MRVGRARRQFEARLAAFGEKGGSTFMSASGLFVARDSEAHGRRQLRLWHQTAADRPVAQPLHGGRHRKSPQTARPSIAARMPAIRSW